MTSAWRNRTKEVISRLHSGWLWNASPCVFIDDLVVNVRGAAAAGMVGVHHDVPRAMRAGLAVLFSIDEASEVADGIEGDASL